MKGHHNWTSALESNFVDRSIISLGDALRAMHALKPADTETCEAVRSMLGLYDEEIITPANPSIGAALPSSKGGLRPESVNAPQPLRWRREPEMKNRAIPPPAVAVGKAVAYTLTQVTNGSGPSEVPASLAKGKDLAADATTEAPAPLPLFSRLQRRGILSAALATYANEGDIDLDAAIESLAALRPLTRLPRIPAPTLRRGVQLLIDRGDGMDPFLADEDGLIRQLDDILSDDRLEVLYFAECPTRGVADRPAGPRRPWRAPPSRVPVLILTDLGIGGPLLADDRASVREWLRFAQSVRTLGHRPIGLVPYEARRWPPLLSRAMVLLHWSELTTARAVHRLTREGRLRR
jgi:hypothetical protein